MMLSQIVENQEFLKQLVKSKDFKTEIENCTVLQLQCIVEILINLEQLSKNSEESLICKDCQSLVDFFEKRKKISVIETKKLFIKKEGEVKDLLSVFLHIAVNEAILCCLDYYDDL